MKSKVFLLLLVYLVLFSIVTTNFKPIYAVENAVTISRNNELIKVKAGSDDTNGAQEWKTVLDKYKGAIIGASGIAALTFLIFFIVNFIKLGQSSGNPQMRSQALMGIVWCGIACTGLGGIAIFFGFFYNVLRK